MLFLILLPFVFVGIAFVASIVCMQMSWLRITSAGVELRNYPQAPKLIPLPQVDHFEATTATGNFKSVRPATGVLVTTDGSRVAVRKVAAPDAGYGIDALNARVDALR